MYPPSPASGADRQRILIVEDSKTHRRNLRDTLVDDYDLHWASNARDALALAFTKRPDLILLDVNIEPPPAAGGTGTADGPTSGVLTGLDVCRRLKKSTLKDTPVVVLTAKKGFIARIKGKFAHADAYLTKPIETATLLETIQRYLGAPQLRVQLEPLTPDRAGSPVASQ